MNITKIDQVKELIKINDFKQISNPLILKSNHTLSELKNSCVTMSMIGTARVGKSTFINAFLSYLYQQNISVVSTSSTADHCTLGIDYIKCECVHNEKFFNLIILDCQGLMYEDSKHDDKLLSIIYSLSDIVIYHDSKIVDNQTLNSLTSLCLVADYIKNTSNFDSKPVLYFRMRDYNLESDSTLVLQNTFANRLDQYDNVRGAIKNLFPYMSALITYPINRSELALLKNKQYLEFFYGDTNFVPTFDILICDIINVLHHNQLNNKCQTLEIFFQKIENILTCVNSNKNISFDSYDYYTLLISKRFEDFWKTVPKYLYDKLEPSVIDENYVIVCNRLLEIDEIIDKFENTFSQIEPDLKKKQIDDFIKQTKEHLLRTENESYKMSRKYIQKTFYTCMWEFVLNNLYKKGVTKIDTELEINTETNTNLKINNTNRYKLIHNYEILNNENIFFKQILKKYCLFDRDGKNKLNKIAFVDEFNNFMSAYVNNVYPMYCNLINNQDVANKQLHLECLNKIKIFYSFSEYKQYLGKTIDFTQSEFLHKIQIKEFIYNEIKQYIRLNIKYHQICCTSSTINKNEFSTKTHTVINSPIAIKTEIESIVTQMLNSIDFEKYFTESLECFTINYFTKFYVNFKNKAIRSNVIIAQSQFKFSCVLIIVESSYKTSMLNILDDYLLTITKNKLFAGIFGIGKTEENKTHIIGTFLTDDFKKIKQCFLDHGKISEKTFNSVFSHTSKYANQTAYQIDTTTCMYSKIFIDNLVKHMALNNNLRVSQNIYY